MESRRINQPVGETEAASSHAVGMAEVIGLAVVWVCSTLMIGLLVINYHAGQKVSLENAILWITLAATITSIGLLFRDAIVESVRHWLANREPLD